MITAMSLNLTQLRNLGLHQGIMRAICSLPWRASLVCEGIKKALFTRHSSFHAISTN